MLILIHHILYVVYSHCIAFSIFSIGMHDALKRYDVIPEVVDDFTPSVDLKISFPKGDVRDGNVFSASELHYIEPDVSFTPPDKHSYYTLVKVDPDAPSKGNPMNREW